MESNYYQEHRKLMDRWKSKEPHKGKWFIEDGIIDFDRWEYADVKIMLFLKEAYKEDDDIFDNICSLIRNRWDGPKYKIWWTVSYWLYALQKLFKNGEIPSLPSNETEYKECREYLLSSAVVEIKKSDGEKTSSYEDLEEYIKKDKELLREQIDLINPQIIICGYTFGHFKKLWSGKDIEPFGKTGLVYKVGKYFVIDWWHPANQYPNKLCYYALCSVVQEAGILRELHN